MCRTAPERDHLAEVVGEKNAVKCALITGASSDIGRGAAVRLAQAGFARALFENVREKGVRVTLVHPGFVNTPLMKTDGLDRSRMIQVEDIA